MSVSNQKTRMCIATLLHTTDFSLGRVDKALFSDQTLMEMVITEITNKEKICGISSESKDIEAWKGVKIEDDKCIQIDWHSYGLAGSLQFEWLPKTVTQFYAYRNQLTGIIDCASLPPAMREFYLGHNALTGTIDLRSLPDELGVLDVSENHLSGSVDLARLPRHIQYIVLRNNRFNGSLGLTMLPGKVEWLDFSENQFSGTIDLSQLPSGMKRLDLSNNQLVGDIFVDAALFDEVNVLNTKLTKRRLKRH